MNERRYQVVMSWNGTPQSSVTIECGAKIVVGESSNATFFVPGDLFESEFTLIETVEGNLVVRAPARGRLVSSDSGSSVGEETRSEPIESLSADGVPHASEAGRGDVVLGPDSRAQVDIGDFSFYIAKSEVESPLPRSAMSFFGWRWIMASFAIHAVVATLMLLSPPAAGALSLDITGSSHRYIDVYLDAAETESVALDQPREAREQGARAGQPSAGESGTAGEQDTPERTGGQIRPAGRTRDPRVPLSRDSIARLDVIRLAGSLHFDGVDSPYGADDAQGAFENSAYGAIDAASAGFSAGMGGLDMNGPGRGGGCSPGQPCGAGTVGVGGLGTGFGTCSGSEFHSLEARLGHASAVEHCASNRFRYGSRTRGGVQLAGRRCENCVPRLRSGSASVAGGLSREAIRRVVTRNRAQIRQCYVEALRGRPDLEGRVTLQWAIHPEGRVNGARVVSSELRHSAAEACMQRAVSRWQFPAATGATMVNYPFILQSN